MVIEGNMMQGDDKEGQQESPPTMRLMNVGGGLVRTAVKRERLMKMEAKETEKKEEAARSLRPSAEPATLDRPDAGRPRDLR